MLQVGDEILISPHNYQAQVASIINTDNENVAQAVAGEAIGITLTQQRFVERGHVISHFDNAPILSNQFYMRLFWLGAENLQHNKTYAIRLHNSILSAEVKQINYVLDTNDLTQSSNDFVAQNQVAEVLWQVRGLASFDEYHQIAAMGRAVVMSGDRIVAGGLLTMQNLPNLRSSPKIITSQNVTCENMEISAQKREARNGHKGGILWFTGLSGSGKSTLAKELQLQLFTRGYQVYVLDGDNVRQGLNADLGFSPKDRTENIRRIGEVASLFADAGMIVITAFISPYASDRRKARSAAPELFHVVHIKAGVEACEMRDVKGLYKKARAGEIGEFTGISAPYEVPVNPELVLDTESAMIDDCVAQLIAYVEKHFGKL
jgi:bifunctional enzyme CysN/CysC